jgi:hypothetical protein
MTRKPTEGDTYYVLRSLVMPGLYKPGIAHNFSQRHRQHGGPGLWETLATYYLGQGAAHEFEQRMLRRFGHRRIAPPPEERMALTDQELAELLALAEEEQAKTAEGRPEPIPPPHAQRQIEHAARLAELGHDAMPPPPTATTAAAAVFMGVPVPPAPAPKPARISWWPWVLGAAAMAACVAPGQLVGVVVFAPLLLLYGAIGREFVLGIFRAARFIARGLWGEMQP